LPAVDVYEDDAGITLLADMPGVPRDQLELKVEGDALSIEGGVRALAPEGLEAVYAEVRVPRYRRTFTLSRELDSARIDASLKDGVLTLRIPKQAHAQPRRIEVRPLTRAPRCASEPHPGPRRAPSVDGGCWRAGPSAGARTWVRARQAARTAPGGLSNMMVRWPLPGTVACRPTCAWHEPPPHHLAVLWASVFGLKMAAGFDPHVAAAA
jgi:HSP20 family molecular chaperone IbpA